MVADVCGPRPQLWFSPRSLPLRRTDERPKVIALEEEGAKGKKGGKKRKKQTKGRKTSSWGGCEGVLRSYIHLSRYSLPIQRMKWAEWTGVVHSRESARWHFKTTLKLGDRIRTCTWNGGNRGWTLARRKGESKRPFSFSVGNLLGNNGARLLSS